MVEIVIDGTTGFFSILNEVTDFDQDYYDHTRDSNLDKFRDQAQEYATTDPRLGPYSGNLVEGNMLVISGLRIASRSSFDEADFSRTFELGLNEALQRLAATHRSSVNFLNQI